MSFAGGCLLLSSCGEQTPGGPNAASTSTTTPSEASDAQRYQRRKRLPATQFSRGAYAGSIRLAPAGVDEAETEDEKRKADALVARARGGNITSQAARDLMAEARQLQTSAILRVAEALLGSPDEAVRAEALMLADGATGPAAVPLLWRGLGDQSPDIRALAMETAQQLEDASIQPFVEAGLQDDNETVRQFALQAGTRQESQTRTNTIVTGLNSAHADVALAALAEAQAAPSKNLLPHVIKTLGHRSPEVKEAAHEMLFLLLGESFSSANQAGSWWSAHQNLFDDDLVLSDLARIQSLAAQRAASVQP